MIWCVVSTFHRSHRHSAYQSLLDKTVENHDRNQCEHRCRGQSSPVYRFIADPVVHPQRQGLRFRARKDQRIQEFVPTVVEREDRRSSDARARQRNDDFVERLEVRTAINQRRLLQVERNVHEVGPHHPDTESQDNRQMHDDDRNVGVDQSHFSEHDEERDHEGDLRHNPRGQNPEQQVLRALGLVVAPRKDIRGRSPQQHADTCRRQGDDQ